MWFQSSLFECKSLSLFHPKWESWAAYYWSRGSHKDSRDINADRMTSLPFYCRQSEGSIYEPFKIEYSMNLPTLVCLYLFRLMLFQIMVSPESINHCDTRGGTHRSLLVFMVSENNKAGDPSGCDAEEFSKPRLKSWMNASRLQTGMWGFGELGSFIPHLQLCWEGREAKYWSKREEKVSLLTSSTFLLLLYFYSLVRTLEMWLFILKMSFSIGVINQTFTGHSLFFWGFHLLYICYKVENTCVIARKTI